MIPWFVGHSESVGYLFQLPEENYTYFYSGKFHLVTANFVLIFSKLPLFLSIGKGVFTGRLTFT